MTRGEKIGLGVAAAAHVVLFGLLSVGFLATPNPMDLQSKPIDVSLVDEISMQSASPNITEAPAPSAAPDIGAPTDAPPPSSDAAADLTPADAQPEPRPAAKPSETPKPAPEKSAPDKPRETKAPAKRDSGKRSETKTESKSQGSSKSTETKKPRGAKLGDDFLKGLSDDGEGKAPTPRAEQLGSVALASLSDAIRRQVQPCANRVSNPGPGANEISTKLRIQMNPDGSLAARPELRGQTGVNGENQRYARRVAELAMSAFIACAPYRLPKQYYDVGGQGWKDIIMTYKLPG